MTSSPYFSGQERLEDFPPLARKMRMGSPSDLSIGDHEVFIRAVKNKRFDDAVELLTLFHSEYQNMLLLLFEWALQLPQSMSSLSDSNTEQLITKACLETYYSGMTDLTTSEQAVFATRLLSELFTQDKLTPDAATYFRHNALEHPSVKLILNNVETRYSEVLTGLSEQNVDNAQTSFIEYTDFVRTLHDGIITFTSVYPITAYEKLGQTVCEQLVQQSFSSCSFFEPLWSLGQLPADALAAFLAEHLRFHFSGHSRKGSVEIIEEKDKYRLVFDSCGSGGAHRRRMDKNGKLTKLPEASPATWGLASQVPAYCTHCAFNEITSIERYGYPIFVTEFNPDPSKPCGWTIYKNSKHIPSLYLERLGKSKAEND